MSKQNSKARQSTFRLNGGIIGGTIVCSVVMVSAFGPAAMASETPDVATPDAAAVEVVDIRVPQEEIVEAPAEPVVVEQPPVTTTEVPQNVVSVDVPTPVAQVVEPLVQQPAPVVQAPSAPADTTAPTATIKPESVVSNNRYGVIGFKLYDAGKVDRVELNGVNKDLSNNVWSDLNGVKPGVFGAAEGKNVLKVYDVAGNVTTLEFTLDATGPSATIKVEGTVGSDGIYQKVSYKLNDPAKVVKAIVNGVEKQLSPNIWSDLNNIVPGTFGAVEGVNTLVLVDALGNQSTLTFTLDTTKPVINTPAAGQWAGGTHTWNITQTEANPAKAYVEIQQLVDGKWKKFDGAWFYDTNNFDATFDTTKLVSGAQTQLKISTWDKVNLHTSATFGGQIDNVAPTLTVKPESIGSDGVYSKYSAKLFDGLSGIDKVTVNGVEKDLTNNKWSDLNNLKPGVFGAVEGENTIVVYDVAGNSTTYMVTLDATAPTATNFAQVYEAKQDGRVAVTLTFSENVSGLGQGWNGSGNTWTKVFYSSKEHTVNFKDVAGNPGSYTFTVDATAPSVVNIAQEWQADKSRNLTTLTFDEPTIVSSQGWYAQEGSNNTVWSKAIFNTKEYTVAFSDAVGNPGTYTFKAKGESEINPPVIGEPEFPETPVVNNPGTPSGGSNTGAGSVPATQVGGGAHLAVTGGSGLFGFLITGLTFLLSGFGLKLRAIFIR